VQSWVQRCCQVPVTTYQKSCYWQPQTTCCTTTQGAPIPVVTQQPAVVQQQAVVQQPPVVQQQVVVPQQTAPPAAAPSITPPSNYPPPSPPNVYEQRTFGTGNPAAPVNAPVMPPATLKAAPPAPPLRLEGIAMLPDSRLEGQVVHNDRTPRAGARVMFVNAQAGQRVVTTANTAGRFSVGLASGNWNVYLYGADDIPVYSVQLQVTGSKR
jgi:hypothetical protein